MEDIFCREADDENSCAVRINRVASFNTCSRFSMLFLSIAFLQGSSQSPPVSRSMLRRCPPASAKKTPHPPFLSYRRSGVCPPQVRQTPRRALAPHRMPRFFKSGTTSRTASKIPTNMPRLFLTRTAEPKKHLRRSFCQITKTWNCSNRLFAQPSASRHPALVPPSIAARQDRSPFRGKTSKSRTRIFPPAPSSHSVAPSSHTPDSTTSSIQSGSSSRQNPVRNRSIRKMNPSVSS